MKLQKITIGLGTCGRASGGLETYEALKKSELISSKKIMLEKTACLGACFAEPIVEVRFDEKSFFFQNLTKDKVDLIISAIDNPEHINPEHLIDFNLGFFTNQTKLVTKYMGRINPLSFDDFAKLGGIDALESVFDMSPVEVIDSVKNSGLRGRGGAGFATWMKWSFVAKHEGEKYIICNADEGDPGAFMNRSLLEGDPFRVITGIIIGAYAMGASKGFIYCREEYPLAIETLNHTIDVMREKGYLGKNIFGKDFSFDIEIKKGAGAFVCGEETALMNSVMGMRGNPNPRPPYPADKGLWGKPTNINNVGTFAHVTTIFQLGVDEYNQYGAQKSKGTKILCLTGHTKYSGVVEVEFGTPLRKLVYDIADVKDFKAVLSGGPSGGCIPASKLDTPLDYESFAELGSIIGSGGMVFLSTKKNLVDSAHYFLSFTRSESCGKCTPCREGNIRMHEILQKVINFEASEKDLELLERAAHIIKDSSLCGLGQTSPNPVLSTLKYFRDDYDEFLKPKFKYYFITDKCVGCHACSLKCPVKCISGVVKEKHEIHDETCIGCGSCYNTCNFNAIVFNKENVKRKVDKK